MLETTHYLQLPTFLCPQIRQINVDAFKVFPLQTILTFVNTF